MLTTFILVMTATAAFDLYMDDTSFLYYDDALQHCRNLGWDLVSIHNEDQYNTANEMCKTQGGGCWIGLRRDSYSDDAWYWTDGTSLDYGFDDDGIAQTGADFWSSGEPNDNGLFGALRNNGEGVWDYFDGTEGNSDSPQFAICDTGITSDTSAVFDPQLDDQRAWNHSDAHKHCRDQGYDLLSIHNDDQMDIANELCGSSWCWIGLRYDEANDEWSWTDGSKLDYGFNDDGSPTTGVWPWHNGEPNFAKKREFHVCLEGNAQGWDDYYDNVAAQRILCNNVTVTTEKDKKEWR